MSSAQKVQKPRRERFAPSAAAKTSPVTAKVAKDVTPPKPRAAAKDDDASLEVTWPIDMSIGIEHRPLTGKDVESFRARHSLQTSDAIYCLCIQNSAKFNEVCRLPSLPFTLELLIRLYDESPGHASWKEVTPQAAFEVLYGSVERDFAGSPLAKDVRLALYRRFTGAMGRSIYTAYRWVQGHGNAKSQVTKVFAKLLALKEPRETLERIARLMYRARGKDYDAMYPYPSLTEPPIPRRRGPPKGSRKAALSPEQALAASERREAAKKARIDKAQSHQVEKVPAKAKKGRVPTASPAKATGQVKTKVIVASAAKKTKVAGRAATT